MIIRMNPNLTISANISIIQTGDVCKMKVLRVLLIGGTGTISLACARRAVQEEREGYFPLLK